MSSLRRREHKPVAKVSQGNNGLDRCPTCKSPAKKAFHPFCSKRCADIDLSRWFNGDYSVPIVELDESDLDELERFVDGADLDFERSSEDQS